MKMPNENTHKDARTTDQIVVRKGHKQNSPKLVVAVQMVPSELLESLGKIFGSIYKTERTRSL